MKVLILAAGYGTRLYPYTKNFPKPLLKVGKRPIINYLLDKVEKLANVSSVLVVTNEKFFKQFQAWKSRQKRKFKIKIINDLTTTPDDRLGAIGDMDFVFSKESFSEDFLVLGGDNLFSGDLRDFMRFAKTKAPYAAIGLFDIKNKKEARHYGVVSINKGSRIIEFYEKPKKPKSSLVAMCLYYFPKTRLGLIKRYLNDPSNSSDASGSYIGWLQKNDKAYGFIFRDLWVDIGHVHTYKKVRKGLKEEK